MFAKIKMYLWLVGAALVAVVTVYFRGKADGKQDLEYEIKDKRLEDLLAAKGIQDEIQTLDDVGLADRASKWVRGNNGG
jgi:beta-lactamase regulating signal transducer with metallopeptidase domain